MTTPELIGITAGFDAVLALISWYIVRSRRTAGLNPPSQLVSHFQSYLLWTTMFLVLTAIAMLQLTGPTQMAVVIISDVALWVSLLYFILLASIGRSRTGRNVAIAIFLILAGAASFNQIANFTGVGLTFGPSITFILTNMAPILMYFVWIPSALLFFLNAARTSDSLARIRFSIFGIGLLLITFSWAWRLPSVMAGISPSTPSILTIMGVSLIGFIGILIGVLYQNKPLSTPRPQFAR